MDWKLINRGMDEMEAIGAVIDNQMAEKRIFFEKNQNVIFLDICKKKIRSCFTVADESKIANCVSSLAEAQHIEASTERNQYPMR